jgi:hypothetical protein
MKPLPVPEAPDNGTLEDRANASVAALRDQLATAEFWKEETAAELEMLETPTPGDRSTRGAAPQAEATSDELQDMVADLQKRLEQQAAASSSSSGEASWEERQREYDSLL